MKLVVDNFISYHRNSRYSVRQRRRDRICRTPCLFHVAMFYYSTDRTPGSALMLCASYEICHIEYVRLENIQRVYKCTLYSTLYSTVYSNISTVSQNVKDQHNIPLSGISISFQYFLTNGKDSIVDCNTRVTPHCVWELCCRDPASSIKHLGGVQIKFFSIPASSDN